MIEYILPHETPVREAPGFMAKEFPLNPDEADYNVAEITLAGRYPKAGWALNAISKMTVYIIEGSVDLVTPETTMTLSAGSLVRIPADQEYQWKPNPTVKMLVISHPAWKADQHRVIA